MPYNKINSIIIIIKPGLKVVVPLSDYTTNCINILNKNNKLFVLINSLSLIWIK